MIKRVLVPLDMTEVAEDVLPLVTQLAVADATVRLIHVAPPPENIVDDQGRTIVYCDQETARVQSEWVDYVRPLVERMGVEVENVVRFGDPVTEILAEAEAANADTVVLSTTTSCVWKRALLGSVAEVLLRRAPIGVLLYRPAPAR